MKNNQANSPYKGHGKDTNDSNKLNPIFDPLSDSKSYKEHKEVLSRSCFPIEAFPQSIQDIIEATHQSLGYPVDFIGVSLLYASSIAVGNTRKIRLKNSFVQSGCIFLALIGDPGTNKSHPYSWALQPILDRDKELKVQYVHKVHQHSENNENPKPVQRKHLVSDFTPEAIIEVIKNNKRGLGVHIDELLGMLKNLTRYNKGSSQEMWLSIWSGKPINKDRVSTESVYLNDPFVSVGGTIQTGVLYQLAKDDRNENGFLDRILFVMPDNIKKPYWNEMELGEDVERSWREIINRLLDIPYNGDPIIINFNSDAKNEILNYQRKLTDSANQTLDESVKRIYSKLDTYLLRLSLIIEMMSYGCGEGDGQSVSYRSVQGAIMLTEYFRETALRVNSIINSDDPYDKLSKKQQIFYNRLPVEFSTKEAVEIALELECFKERAAKTFLTKKQLFEKISHGHYRKLL